MCCMLLVPMAMLLDVLGRTHVLGLPVLTWTAQLSMLGLYLLTSAFPLAPFARPMHRLARCVRGPEVAGPVALKPMAMAQAMLPRAAPRTWSVPVLRAGVTGAFLSMLVPLLVVSARLRAHRLVMVLVGTATAHLRPDGLKLLTLRWSAALLGPCRTRSSLVMRFLACEVAMHMT